MAAGKNPSKRRPVKTGVVIRAVGRLIGVLMTGVIIAFGWLFFDGQQPVLRDGAKPVELVIPYGTSAKGVAVTLREAGLQVNDAAFLMQSRWLNAHRSLRAGVYEIEPGVTRRQLIERLIGADPSQTELRILEGWTVRQAIEAIARNPDIRFDLASYRSQAEFGRAIGIDGPGLEGWIYPDLYVVKKNSPASELLRRSVKIQQTLVAAEWEKRAQGLPYRNMTEALIVASIVEKETQFPGDREKVAAVFSNRYRLGMPLQADPTVIYGLGSVFDGNLTRAHLKKDGPYNTYTRKSLPPTPIANPGPRAIRAVMQPADSRAVYFVARGDGSSQFSDNLSDHNTAVNRYIRKSQ